MNRARAALEIGALPREQAAGAPESGTILVADDLRAEEPEADDRRAEGRGELEFDWVFRRYSSYVAAVAHRLLGRDDEVDDTVQEVFLVAVRGLAQVRDPGAIKAWLARIAVRVARRKLRVRRFRTLIGFSDITDHSELADGAASPEERALLSRVYRALDTLPANQRIAWTLRYIEGERLEAVAELTGCSLATAKRRIGEAASALEEIFSDE